jgi:hypothetical protein
MTVKTRCIRHACEQHTSECARWFSLQGLAATQCIHIVASLAPKQKPVHDDPPSQLRVVGFCPKGSAQPITRRSTGGLMAVGGSVQWGQLLRTPSCRGALDPHPTCSASCRTQTLGCWGKTQNRIASVGKQGACWVICASCSLIVRAALLVPLLVIKLVMSLCRRCTAVWYRLWAACRRCKQLRHSSSASRLRSSCRQVPKQQCALTGLR